MYRNLFDCADNFIEIIESLKYKLSINSKVKQISKKNANMYGNCKVKHSNNTNKSRNQVWQKCDSHCGLTIRAHLLKLLSAP